MAKKAKSDTVHLHWSYGQDIPNMEEEFKITSTGIGLCGAKDLPKGKFVLDLKKADCPKCLEKSKELKAKPKPKEEPAVKSKGKGKAEAAPVAKAKGNSKDKAPAPAKAKGINPAGVIISKVKQNPRRQGTGRHERMAVLLKHNGKTVKEFVAAGGNMDTLKIALQESIVEIKG